MVKGIAAIPKSGGHLAEVFVGHGHDGGDGIDGVDAVFRQFLEFYETGFLGLCEGFELIGFFADAGQQFPVGEFCEFAVIFAAEIGGFGWCYVENGSINVEVFVFEVGQSHFKFLQLSAHGFQFSQNGEVVLLTREHVESHVKMADDEAQSHHQYHEE